MNPIIHVRPLSPTVGGPIIRFTDPYGPSPIGAGTVTWLGDNPWMWGPYYNAFGGYPFDWTPSWSGFGPYGSTPAAGVGVYQSLPTL